MSEDNTIQVDLTKLEVAAGLAAIQAVSDGAPEAPPADHPLATTERKLAVALSWINDESDPS